MSSISDQSFIDGVGDIRLRDGIVRMDLLALSPTRRDQEGNPVPQFTDQLVMSPAAFMRMVSALGSTVKQMREQGMLSSPAAEQPSVASPVKKKQEKKGSPNF
jgi:hypothetical protein